MTINTEPIAHQHFSGSGTDDVNFGGTDLVGRSIRHLILNTSGDVSMSLDGTNFMPLANTTHVFNIPIKRIWFTGGDWDGVGTGV